MSEPTTRQEFAKFCLRQLGSPVIQVNVSEEQVDDCIDMALKYFYDYHYDGVMKVYASHQLTDTDITNKWIPVSEEVIGIVSIFNVSSAFFGTGIWNIRYQIVASDLYLLGGMQIAPYFMAMQNLEFIEQQLTGSQPIRFNRFDEDKLWIDMSWDQIQAGEYIVAETYIRMNPEVYPKVWKDRWLANYATALIKRMFGINTKKFEGMTMPGGIKYTGQRNYDEATKEIERLEMILQKSQYPSADLIA